MDFRGLKLFFYIYIGWWTFVGFSAGATLAFLVSALAVWVS